MKRYLVLFVFCCCAPWAHAQTSVPGYAAIPCALEGETCAPPMSPAKVMFANGARQSAVRSVTAPIACTTAVWGDIDPGKSKACYTLVPITYGAIAVEGGSFNVSSRRTVRYGAPTYNRWVVRTVKGKATCSAAFFSSDPSPNEAKVCQIASTSTPIPPVLKPVMAPMDGMPSIDLSSIAPEAIGWDYTRLATTSEVPPPSYGDFRTLCPFSHMSFDDPIVYPGQTGMSHLHTFFGNSGTAANSTAKSIAGSGSSTCSGGIINRSAYWVPTMIDTRDGTPLVPTNVGIYYKNSFPDGRVVRPVPAGLRMIAGDHLASSNVNGNYARFKCIGGPNDENDNYGPTIPNCQVGASLTQEIFFPNCWNGKDLDSADHRSHMALSVGGSCPATHPVPIPKITFNVAYVVQAAGDPLRWRLASDMYPATSPAGYSSHGDLIEGWDPSVSEAWVNGCLRAMRDCHAHLIGDGRSMY